MLRYAAKDLARARVIGASTHSAGNDAPTASISRTRTQTKRIIEFERDYPALLLALSSGVRTGLDPFSALCKCRDLFQAETEMYLQLSKLQSAIEQGKSEDSAVNEFAEDIAHPDLQLFRAAFMLARREGASLSESLQRLVRVTRQRQSFRRKVKAAVAMQRFSAFGITLCTVVIAAIQTLSSPEALESAWNHPVGMRALCAAVLLILTGMTWMFSITRTEV